MDWIEVAVETTAEAADAVSEALMRSGAKGTQVVDRADVPAAGAVSSLGEWADEAVTRGMPDGVVVKAWYPSPEDARLARDAVGALKASGLDAGPLSVDEKAVRDEDWAENWKKYFKPFRVGKRLVVKPSWEPYDAQPGDLVIHLDPGMAFGTGTHETTALCLELLEERYQGGDMLDVGTGSGILAIAASLLGCPRALAVDLDPLAVKTAAQNAERNGLEGRVEVRLGDLARDVSGQFSCIAANILADIIIRLAPSLRPLMTPGAFFLASGIIRDREADVLDALSRERFRLLERRCRGEWVALAFSAES
ncbi:MAG TPA: 50S ribosomal protein L11 methyltransferase [Candidatus Limnocylindria bacterium]|nr:50S ribosomal protein L11 methyltransferase [Candidatus Limnocylindria bacterium]